MHTKDFLAQELEKAGLAAMAAKAREGYYHDFLSPLAMPCQQLAADLLEIGTVEALTLRQRHINGEFDANTEESKEWAKSLEGRRAMLNLVKRR